MQARGSDLVAQVEPLCDALAEVYFTDRYPGFDLDRAASSLREILAPLDWKPEIQDLRSEAGSSRPERSR